MNNSSAVWRAWVMTALWFSVIVLESFFGSSAHTSRFVLPILHFLFPGFNGRQLEIAHEVVRKTGHFLGYSTLSFLLYRAWWTTVSARLQWRSLSWRAMFSGWMGKAAVLALLGTLAVAGLDEFHQRFDPTRGPSIRDVALDEMGGVLAQLVIISFSSGRAPKLREET
jgi:VanZ family protein